MSLTLAQRGTAASAISLPVVVAFLGASFYAVLLLISARMGLVAFGHNFYDQVWLALLEGRLDLPVRVLRLEGHYAPDGTAYFYHGLGPLVIRAVLDPLVKIGQFSLSPFSIWLWAVTGTALYQIAFLRVVSNASPLIRTGLSALLWFGGPGVILAGNHAFYHEPIAMAYALGGGFVLIWVRAVDAGRMSGAALLSLALLAALCVHARPNLAAALYVGVGLAALWALWGAWTRLAVPALLAATILGAGGYSYLALTEARFGDKAVTHGTFEQSAIRYGSMFWGLEKETDLRARTFIEHGRFNARRILPNALAYAIVPPEIISPKAHMATRNLHFLTTRHYTGFIRFESPTSGILFLWTGWMILAGAGLFALRRARPGQLALLATAGVSAVLIFAYATITLRYLLALWPLVAVLALIGLPQVVRRLETMPPTRMGMALIATLFGVAISLQTVVEYRHEFREEPDTFFTAWDAAICRFLVLRANLPEHRVAALCRDPRIET